MEKLMRGRILIVDDDVSIQKTLNLLLRDDFEVVQSISNPKFILSEIEKNRYDVILLDMNFSIGKQSGDEGAKNEPFDHLSPVSTDWVNPDWRFLQQIISVSFILLMSGSIRTSNGSRQKQEL